MDKSRKEINLLLNKSVFSPRKCDFRPGLKGFFSYDEIIRKNFDELECALFDNKFIDENYNFTGIYGKKKELAAIFYAMIHHYFYFAKTSYKIHRNYTQREIRLYLDHRYNIKPNSKQLFNLVCRTPNISWKVLEKYPDIENIINNVTFEDWDYITTKSFNSKT